MSQCPIAGDANVYELIELSNTKQTLPGASILRGVGRAISHIFKNGGLTVCTFWVTYFDRLLLLLH